MSPARSRRVVTTGSISLALALAAPLAAFAAPGDPQGPPADPGAQRSATATATIGEQTPPAGAGGANNQGVGDEEASDRKVTLCHATGSASNPYVLITVSKAAVLNAHADHQDGEDIIPSFTYTDGSGATQTFAAQGDQSILAAQCAAAADEGEGDTGADTGTGTGTGAGADAGGDGVAEDATQRRVTLCHATGSQSNPYVLVTVAVEAVLNGHADHQDGEDIIPSFTYTDRDGVTQTFAAQGDQSILAEQCAAAAAETEGDTGAGAGGGDAQPPVQGGGDAEAPVQSTSPDQPAQNPTTPGQGTSPEQAGESPAAPEEISGGTQAPAVGGLPQTPTPAPAPAPAAPSDTAVAPALGEGTIVEQGVTQQEVSGTTAQAATVGLTPVPTTVSARGAAGPATLPFTGGAEMSILLALGVGALGLGGIANRMGARELQAKHARR